MKCVSYGLASIIAPMSCASDHIVVMLSIHMSYVSNKFSWSMSSMIPSSTNIIVHRSHEKEYS
jgi:hypothetical protein